jgi:transposase InsO family protein
MVDEDREFLRKVAEAYPRVGPTDPEARTRILSRVRREGARREQRVTGLSPAWLAAAALVLMFAGGMVGWTLRSRLSDRPGPGGDLPPDFSSLSSTSEVRIVRFVLAAPRASRVTVVGDFNDWDPGATPMRRRTAGAWVASIPLPPGRHVYAFIVDGDRWVPDPAAPLAPEDGFGIRNSVIVVGESDAT